MTTHNIDEQIEWIATNLGLGRQVDSGSVPYLEAILATLRSIKQAEPVTLPCGHHPSLAVNSAETGRLLYCELCDARERRNDAEQIEWWEQYVESRAAIWGAANEMLRMPTATLATLRQVKQAEPVAWVDPNIHMGGYWHPHKRGVYYTKPLYAAPQPVAAPEGWVMVPKEPTKEMQHAYMDSIDRNLSRVEREIMFGRFDNHRMAWKAALAAAPAAPQSETTGTSALDGSLHQQAAPGREG